jgi:hypothetical protein
MLVQKYPSVISGRDIILEEGISIEEISKNGECNLGKRK